MSEQLKIPMSNAKVFQRMRFFREGSLLAGSIRTGLSGIRTNVEIQSDEPEERVRHLLKMAEQTCFALRSLMAPVSVETQLILNGQPLGQIP